MPVEVLNPRGKGRLLLVCDHASNEIPAAYENLGLDDKHLERHIAWDIGAADLTRALSKAFDAPAVLARFSRLLIDPNRALDSETLIPEQSDGVIIPGNRGIDAAERDRRIARFYRPFHDSVARQVATMKDRGEVPLVIAMHSFTPVMNGTPRPWQAGLLWDRDPRLAQAFLDAFRARGIHVGDNEPYSGRELFHTMTIHGAAHGLPQTTLEVRQDLIGNDEGVAEWARLLTEIISELLALPHLASVRYYDNPDMEVKEPYNG
ncbi:MAG: N-formylglutamate amidohydrolase [Alphaproteobacteria bacterium]|nr:MAG: N-formylglutamate amidohydrolase [Alphaproteobacteria bacterium]